MAIISIYLILAALLAPQAISRSPAVAATLDYAVFKDKVQPILTTARKGNARCIACHSRGGGNSYLEGLSPGATSYNEEQSAPQLRARGAPRRAGRSAQEPPADQPAGGRSRRQPLARRRQALAVAERSGMADARRLGSDDAQRSTPPATAASAAASAAGAASPAAAAAPATTLNLEVFKTRVQPILTSPRKGNARCIACHSRGGGNSYLEALSPGRHDLQRRADAPQFRARPAARRAGRAAEEPAARQPAGGRSRRQPLARRRQALAVAERPRVADARGLGARVVIRRDVSRPRPDAGARRATGRKLVAQVPRCAIGRSRGR